ncbi:hypothetical protein J6590_005899 [Homalodisca vitripennis]|nr:hypothetical protein J6590_005899 [Homalodisca vitripennis]
MNGSYSSKLSLPELSIIGAPAPRAPSHNLHSYLGYLVDTPQLDPAGTINPADLFNIPVKKPL